MLTFS